MEALELRKILVAEDEPDLLDILCEILAELGAETFRAENGIKALEIMRTQNVHAVLSDIMMPEMTGLECLAVAQAEGLTAPFVFITGYGDNNRMQQAIRLGALDFIRKPFDAEDLTTIMNRAIEVGVRRSNISKQIASADADLHKDVQRGERMISLLRGDNNKKQKKE